MSDESKTEEKREEKREDSEKRDDSALHAKLDKLSAHLDSLHSRMDTYESRKDKSEKEEEEEEEEREDAACMDKKDSKRKDSKKKDSEEALPGKKESDREAEKEEREENGLKAKDSKKKDSEEESRKDSQPPVWAQALTDRLAAIESYVSNAPTEDNAKFADVWNKAERLAQLHCDSAGAPKWAPGESLHAYTCRAIGKYKAHSPAWKDVDLSKVTEPAAFAVATSQIYNDAEAAATKPENVPSGELRKVVKNVGGREIITWVARNDDACWRQFTNVSLRVGKFLRPPRGVAHVPSEQA